MNALNVLSEEIITNEIVTEYFVLLAKTLCFDSNYGLVYVKFYGRLKPKKWSDGTTSSQNVLLNKSNIELKGVIEGGSWYASGCQYSIDYNPTINVPGTVYNEYEVKIEKEVSHNSDGKLQLSSGFWFKAGGWGSASANATFKILDIPRASSISLDKNEINIGETLTIIRDKKVNTYVDRIKFESGNYLSYIYDERTMASSDNITWDTSTIASELYQLTPNSNKLSGQITIETYSNDTLETLIGTNRTNIDLLVTDANPTGLSINYMDDSNGDTQHLTYSSPQNPIFIKGYSTLEVQANLPIAQKGANMNYYQIVCGEKQEIIYEKDIDRNLVSWVTFHIPNMDNNTFIIYAVDSRGNVTSLQRTCTNYIIYEKPSITNMEIDRNNSGVDEHATLSIQGTFFNYNFGHITNGLIASYKYREYETTEWINGTSTITLITDGNNFSFHDEIAGDLSNNGFDLEKSYEVQVTINDYLDNDIEEETFGTGTSNLSLHKNGTALNELFDENEPYELQASTSKANFKELYENCIRVLTKNDIDVINNTNGTAIKLSNGIMICFGNRTTTMSNDTQVGNLWYTGSFDLGQYPVSFISTPKTILQNKGPYSIVEYNYGNETNIGSVYMMNGTSRSNQSVNVSFIAIGLWKAV